MRTTIVIEDSVFRQARKRAQELKTTLSSLIEDTLRKALDERPARRPKRRPFKLVLNTGPGLTAGHAWETVARQVLNSDASGLP